MPSNMIDLVAVDNAIGEMLSERDVAPELPSISVADGPRCLITGVILYDTHSKWIRHGDLFVYGDRFIVNASGEGHGGSTLHNDKVLSYNGQDHHFERRNVYVFPAHYWMLNHSALKYIQEAL